MSVISSAFGTKVAIVAVSLVAIGGGTAVAAATGAVSSESSTEVAGSDTVIDTPTETRTAEPTETPTAEPTETPSPEATETPTADEAESPSADAAKGPDATGPAAFGLCTAYTAGGLNSTSVAYTALLTASQSLGSIEDYCSPILEEHVSNGHQSDSAPEKSNGHGRSDQKNEEDSPATPDQ